jgi:hypothetical protein
VRVLLTILCVVAASPLASAATRTVCASGCTYTNSQLQTALDAAVDGDVVLVEGGHLYTAPSDGYVLGKKCATPAWNCITLRTGVTSTGVVMPASAFPATGVRVGTSYRGVFAKFVPSANNAAAIRTVYPGETGSSCTAQPCTGSGWTLQYLEFGPKLDYPEKALVRFGTAAAGKEWNGSIWVNTLPNGQTQDTLIEVPKYLSLIQCDVHGDATVGQHQGLRLSSADTRVWHNSFRDIKSASSETQAITGFNGIGPHDVENNYIEGSGENVMWGGADSYLQLQATITGSPTTTSVTLATPLWRHLDGTTEAASLTTDIYSGIFVTVTHSGTEYGGMTCTLSGSTCTLSPAMPVTPSAGDVVKWTWVTGGLTFKNNWVYKPPEWRGVYIVKNNFELKHCDGGSPAGPCLIEGNVFDYAWCCSQNMLINIKVWNQDGGDVSSTVRNLTFRHNLIRHGVRGLNLTSTHSETKPSGTMTDVTIEDNVFLDMSSAWGGTYTAIQVTSGNYANHVGSRGCIRCTIQHNTFLADTAMDGPLWFVMTGAGDTNADFIYRNNISIRQGSLALRAYINDAGQSPGTTSWNAAVSGSSVASHNVWPDASSGTYTFSTSSQFPTNTAMQAALVSYSACVAGTTASCALSGATAYDDAASDGTDIGANVTTVKTQTDLALNGAASSGLTTETIQAEDYNAGGEGVGYHDLDVGDLGAGPDLEATSDTGGGSNVGYAFAGEWLKYTVTVAATGFYAFDFRVSSDGDGGTFHLEVDGVNVTGSLTIPDTNDWQSFVTISKSAVPMTSGSHVLTLAMDTNSATTAVGNFNWFAFTQATPGNRIRVRVRGLN